jgi:hypothetical protein
MPYYFTIGCIAIGSINAAVAFLHLRIFLRRRQEWIHLVFATMALCGALATIFEIRMHHAMVVEDFVRYLKATHTVQVPLWIAFAGFIKLYTPDTHLLQPSLEAAGAASSRRQIHDGLPRPRCG